MENHETGNSLLDAFIDAYLLKNPNLTREQALKALQGIHE